MLLPLRYPDSGHVHPWPTGEDILDPGTDPARVWIPGSPPSGVLVLGNSQTPETEIDLEAAEADGVPVYQRKGGGGAVFLTDGCVCVALRFRRNPEWAIADYFAAGNGLVASALREAFGIAAGTRGVSDLAVGDKKIAGSSLYLPRQCGVYLASILVNMRLGDLDRYLRHPSREPDYRGRRAHADFVANLADLPGAAGATPESARALLENHAARPDFAGNLDAAFKDADPPTCP